ncbi:nitrate reductase [Selenomonas flueggei]|uniref:nitrate reductase n=1 Tax=Selenomonas flueggei TaxID=135080 RepID=UPI002671C9C6|nr:nitrate reductase [Selenomonas flueggei]
MNERYGWIGAALCRAFVLVCAAVLVLTATAALLTRAGMSFAGAYTGGVLAAAVGTLIVSRNGATRILLPSPAITAWLVYEEIIARGIAWQDALIVSAVTALIGVLLMRTVFMGRMIDGLPPVIRTGLLLSLALGMLTQAAQAARILLPSPWALTMGGMLSDPLTYFTLVGILLVLLLYVQQKTAALPVGIGIILLLTWGEGFWEIPAAPFLQPAFVLPMETMVGTLDIPAAIGLGITLLIALTVESTAVLAADVRCVRTADSVLTRVFAVSGIASLIGAAPLIIAPISAALPAAEERHIGGIPSTAMWVALLLLLLLPCAPLLAALAEFPAAPALALTVLGLMLLRHALVQLRITTSLTLRDTAVLAVFVLTSYDLQTGLTLALLTWVLLTAAGGAHHHIHRSTAVLTAVLVLSQLFPQLR